MLEGKRNMAHRTILTNRQRGTLFALPTDEPRLLRHYTLSDEDLEQIGKRRRPRNRLGFAVQLCALRFPGRALTPGELIPAEITSFVAAQLGLKEADLETYAVREETRHEHMALLREAFGYRAFSGCGARDLKIWLDREAELATSNEDIARRFVDECRRTQTILPAITTVERLCADALVAAERRIETRIAQRLSDDLCDQLDVLLYQTRGSPTSCWKWTKRPDSRMLSPTCAPVHRRKTRSA